MLSGVSDQKTMLLSVFVYFIKDELGNLHQTRGIMDVEQRAISFVRNWLIS